jgi:hypothetical protein
MGNEGWVGHAADKEECQGIGDERSAAHAGARMNL